jgi:hypothetical protein
MTARSSLSELALDRYAAFLASLTFDVYDGAAVVGGADVTSVGLTQLIGAQAGQQSSEDECEISLVPVGLALGIVVARHRFQERLDSGAGESLRDGLGELWPSDVASLHEKLVPGG